MIWVKRILFTFIYLLTALFLISYLKVPSIIVLLLVIGFSGYISRNGVLADLNNFILKKNT